MSLRPSGRQPNDLRAVEVIPHFSKHAEGSCLIKFGDTHVLCTATVEEKVPGWMLHTPYDPYSVGSADFE